jgi:hypothetical protein
VGERELPERVRERLAAREASRRALARLPIEEKVRIIVRMQKAARAIALATGRPPPRVWDLPTD